MTHSTQMLSFCSLLRNRGLPSLSNFELCKPDHQSYHGTRHWQSRSGKSNASSEQPLNTEVMNSLLSILKCCYIDLDAQSEDELAKMMAETDELMSEVQNRGMSYQTKRPRNTEQSSQTINTGLPRFSPYPKNPVLEKPLVTLHCDVSGCTISPVTGSVEFGERSMEETEEAVDVFLLKGKGWRIGINDEKEGSQFSAFVGGDDWLISLAKEEYLDFVNLLRNLRRGVATLEVCGDWGTEGSEATLEMHTSRVWMQGRASQKRFIPSLVFLSKKRAQSMSRLTILNRFWSRRSFDGEEFPTVAFSLQFKITNPDLRPAEGYWSANAVMEFLEAFEEKASHPSSNFDPISQEL